MNQARDSNNGKRPLPSVDGVTREDGPLPTAVCDNDRDGCLRPATASVPWRHWCRRSLKLEAQAEQLAAQAAQLKEQDAALAAFRRLIPQLTFRSRIDVTGTNCIWRHEAKEEAACALCSVPTAMPVHSSQKGAHPILMAHPAPAVRPF